jgi:methionine-rich copper-binding protein CopC
MKATTRIGALLAGLILLAAGQARAQCSYETSVPSDGDVLAAVPAPMIIKFLLGIHLQNVRLVGDDGTVWPLDWTSTEDNVFKAEFRVTQPLPPGQYRIEWTAYVRQHYHPDGGVIPFTVAAPGSSGAGATTPAAAPPAGAAPRAASGWPYRALQAGSAPPAGR